MRRKCSFTVLATALAGALVAASSAQAQTSAANYRVLGFNNLGMHCYDSDFSVFSILPPFNVIQSQVIRRGAPPRVCTSTDVSVWYSATTDAAGSINTTSAGKTNFFQYSQALFGVKLPVDTGILGAPMPGTSNKAKRMSYASTERRFLANGIPITAWDDHFEFNPYPLYRLQAVPAGGTLAQSAKLDVVVPVSSEMGCANCHATGKMAARRTGVTFSNNTNPDLQYRENVLILHDAVHGTKLFQSKPVLCASCHYSKALDLSGAGPTGAQVGKENASEAVHRRHGLTIDGKYPTSTAPAIIPESGAASCYNCHPGTITNCLRGVMSTAQVQCQACHGGMLQVAGEYTPRAPWTDLPKCQSCHTGDAASHLGTTLPGTVAFTDSLSAKPIIAVNKRFAEPANALYRNSRGHGGVDCGGCHGSPHAEWPASNLNGSDNVAAKQLQGHVGAILECNVCHSTSPTLGLGGPHGMHSVNDANWISKHHDLIGRLGLASCKACHGQDLKGDRLSKTPVARTFRVEERTVTVAAGTRIACNTCHSWPAD